MPLDIYDAQGNVVGSVDGKLTFTPKVQQQPNAGLIPDSTRPQNVAYNNRIPTPSELATFHAAIGTGGLNDPSYMLKVDGQFRGTTAQILEHFADKWGFSRDIAKAIAYVESKWKQDAHGDLHNVDAQHPNGGSWGIMQIKQNDWPASYPLSHLSTPFNVDFALANDAAVRDGKLEYLNDPDRDAAAKANWQPTYKFAAGDLRTWGAIGAWFSGGWLDAASNNYIQEVKAAFGSKPWNVAGF